MYLASGNRCLLLPIYRQERSPRLSTLHFVVQSWRCSNLSRSRRGYSSRHTYPQRHCTTEPAVFQSPCSNSSPNIMKQGSLQISPTLVAGICTYHCRQQRKRIAPRSPHNVLLIVDPNQHKTHATQKSPFHRVWDSLFE